jgi:hypothetical protein
MTSTEPAKFPVFFPVSREFPGGEKFASDCVHRQPVSVFLSVPTILAETGIFRPNKAEFTKFICSLYAPNPLVAQICCDILQG